MTGPFQTLVGLRNAAFALGLAALAGCVHTHERETPDPVSIPSAYPAVTGELGAAPQVCSSIGGTDLSPLQERLSANLGLRSALARLRRADAIARQRGAALMPRMDLDLALLRSNAIGLGNTPGGQTAATVKGSAESQFQASFPASYEIDLWGRLRSERDAAVLQAGAQLETLRTLEVTLSAQLAEAWLGLVAQRQLLDLLDEQLEASRRFLELTRLRFGQGQRPAQDIGRQKQQVQSLEGQRELVIAEAERLRSQLAVLLAGSANDLVLPAARSLPAAPAVPDPGIPALVVESRPDVRAARLQLQAADHGVAAAVAARLPSVRLTASVFSNEREFSDLFGEFLWQAGIGTATPLFDGGALRARVAQAEAEADEAVFDYAQTLLSAWDEVYVALVQSVRQDAFVGSLSQQLDEARKVLMLVRDAYRQGQEDYLNVLTSLLSQQNLEQQLIGARQQQLADRIQLCRALGIGIGKHVHVASTQ